MRFAARSLGFSLVLSLVKVRSVAAYIIMRKREFISSVDLILLSEKLPNMFSEKKFLRHLPKTINIRNEKFSYEEVKRMLRNIVPYFEGDIKVFVTRLA